MSLVDYASSSEDEEVEEDQEPQHYKQDTRDERQVEKERPNESAAAATVPLQFPQCQPKSSSSHSTYRHPDVVIPSNAISMEKLPDASILLSSPSFSPQQYAGTDHSSRIASTIPEIASRKREPNGSGFIHPPNKHPRGNLPHSRNILDTVSGTLIPPQLKGRSNVVTEDIRKLFVNRHREPSG
ncbi:uncharacterized protein LOC110099582 isoform X1 [Dendrobium catenatum]|uniref:Uncharacterized protein n=1 Tax=Dendrobium catenatum TaxID=906689 RepID=A0A2I0WF02_9ASPA|nr:uncharacterized protein LOC110099582 isoform X1 [Dendrobium catenatum]PKU74240.1 hypothetical protein MA16_Dca021644 [Dendrobium catenatum]